MRIRKLAVISEYILMSTILLAPVARADEWNEATRLTFNQPMEIPGHKILAAGTYWLVTMADVSDADRNIVRILNADRSRTLAVLPTVAIQRPEPTASTEINFAKSQDNEPNALVSWFYPGRRTGHEFVYSGSEEKAVASGPLIKVLAGQSATAYGD